MRSGWAYSVASSLRRKPKSVMLASCASRTASAVGSGYGGQHGHAGGGGLLHHLEAGAAGHQHHAGCRGQAVPRQRRPACPARCAGPRPRAAGRWCRRRRPSLRRGWRRSGRAGAGARACRAWRPARPGRAVARRRPQAAPAAALQAGFPRRTGRSRYGRPWRGGRRAAPRRRWRFPAAPRCRRIAVPRRCRASAALSMMPSDGEPNAKSSRSAGVASMVAWLMPLYSSATGVSSARWSASVADATAPARIRVTWAGMLSWRSSAGWLMLCVRIVAAGGVWRRRRRAVRARRDGIISPSSPRRSRGPLAQRAGCPRSATIGAAIPKAGTRA